MMINNIWINRAAVLTLLLFVYAVGYDYARQNAAQAHDNHAAAHLELNP
jgi:predicted transglutaminase-like protease